jgi:hypothetical protein
MYYKKLMVVLFLLCCLLTGAFSGTLFSKADSNYITVNTSAGVEADSVYVCLSREAYAYHCRNNCRGLRQCTHIVKRASIGYAQIKLNRRACGYCY